MSLKLFGYYLNCKRKVSDFMKKEKGSSEIIALVLIIAIVLVLAGIFWDKIQEFFKKLWDNLIGDGSKTKFEVK